MGQLRNSAFLGAALVMAGCVTASRGDGIETASLADGAVVVGGPPGYCIDPETYPRGPDRTFAMIASCRNLTGDDTGPMVEPMVVTVTVAEQTPQATLPDASALAEEVGQRMIGGIRSGGLTLTHLASGGTEVIADGDPRYWRGTFLQGQRMVGLALYAGKGSPLAGAEGAAMLRAVRDRIGALSPKG
ncbi:dihydroxy-acid dehydratase [Citreicella sp. C3M06]|uniref:dihydroxy-acid dehydratase n=1 Tax=Roseobacteraceae TaxID=2854170 RepID=UPI001C09A9B6|nr:MULTISPECIES: dihydroxy-acid dehydratase [Roseobacteraceae]MBU2963775.1 dihydroxy-acid dehydratase [Citreicella sp. C3M06]MDO6584855.1 dihydroxy-acid dehydratase [Salipiger sp. 1_MG-2023]